MLRRWSILVVILYIPSVNSMSFLEKWLWGADTEWWKYSQNRRVFIEGITSLSLEQDPSNLVPFWATLPHAPSMLSHLIIRSIGQQIGSCRHLNRFKQYPNDICLIKIRPYYSKMHQEYRHEYIIVAGDGRIWRKDINNHTDTWNVGCYDQNGWNSEARCYQTGIAIQKVTVTDNGSLIIADKSTLYYLTSSGLLTCTQLPEKDKDCYITQLVGSPCNKYWWVVWSDGSLYCYHKKKEKYRVLHPEREELSCRRWQLSEDGRSFVCLYDLVRAKSSIPFIGFGLFDYDVSGGWPEIESSIMMIASKDCCMYPLSSAKGIYLKFCEGALWLCGIFGELYQGKLHSPFENFTVQDMLGTGIAVCIGSRIDCYGTGLIEQRTQLEVVTQCCIGYVPNLWAIAPEGQYLATVTVRGELDLWECPALRLSLRALILYACLTDYRKNNQNQIKLHDGWLRDYREVTIITKDYFNDILVPPEPIEDEWTVVIKSPLDDDLLCQQSGCSLDNLTIAVSQIVVPQ